MKVKACQKVRDNAYDAVKNMRKANVDMNEMLVNVREYQRRVTVEVTFLPQSTIQYYTSTLNFLIEKQCVHELFDFFTIFSP